jgi:hypothetical protein
VDEVSTRLEMGERAWAREWTASTCCSPDTADSTKAKAEAFFSRPFGGVSLSLSRNRSGTARCVLERPLSPEKHSKKDPKEKARHTSTHKKVGGVHEEKVQVTSHVHHPHKTICFFFPAASASAAGRRLRPKGEALYCRSFPFFNLHRIAPTVEWRTLALITRIRKTTNTHDNELFRIIAPRDSSLFLIVQLSIWYLSIGFLCFGSHFVHV